ncbi:MAG: FAD-dependent oxidoreductase [Rhabdochlamydiaceae bacterium]
MQQVPTEFDVIVIGGGICGLTAAAYLAKSGLKTVVIERRDQLGTHETTEEWSYPGFRTSPHATTQWVGQSLHGRFRAGTIRSGSVSGKIQQGYDLQGWDCDGP